MNFVNDKIVIGLTTAYITSAALIITSIICINIFHKIDSGFGAILGLILGIGGVVLAISTTIYMLEYIDKH